ncbi:MAG: BatA domain-containing protein [Isosphaeraceae bacterium]
MEIGLVHAGIAAGAALAALPVILHLFMRQTPKKVVFPALRLIRERHKRSKKKLRVKNWLLLLARMALLALMALALARPTLKTEASLGDQEVPTAIGLVFDTSLSMGYTERDKSRLDEAKDLAGEILSKTPSSSLIFVIDSAEPGVPPGLSPSAALKRIQGLALRPTTRPLNVAVGQAFSAVAEIDKPRREVYVMTDLARTAWDLDSNVEALEKAEKAKIGTYVLRLTPAEVRNTAVVDARPASGVAIEGEPVEVRTRIRSVGPAVSRVAELRLDGVVREKRSLEIPANGEVDVRFTIPKVDAEPSPHQGEVRILGEPDPLAFDDVRYFSFQVKPAIRVLVVADESIDTRFIGDAIDPDPAVLGPGTPRPYRADRIKTSEFLEKSAQIANQYQCVFLNNVSELSDAEWGRLGGFVRAGGGLVVALGGKTLPSSYQGATASQVLPAVPDRATTPKPPTTFGQVADYTHPLFGRYSRELDDMLASIPVSRYWSVLPREGTRVLLSYADQAPALLERTFKGSRIGRVLLWTTPLSRRSDPESRDAWNEFPLDILGWSFVYLMDQSVAYLTGAGEREWDVEAGRDVALPLDPAKRSKSYLLQGPDGKSQARLAPTASGDLLLVVAPEQLGHWKVSGETEAGGRETFGFSVNGPVAESQFTPLETADLDKLFGDKSRYALADSPKGLRDVVTTTRVGRELFPWIMLMILVIVTVESMLANRFYRETTAQTLQPGLKPVT